MNTDRTGEVGAVDGQPFLRIDARPAPLRWWLREMWAHRQVLRILARKDFQIRYKRTTLGLLWALAVPVIQAGVMALVFTKVARFGATGLNYPVYVLSGVLIWSYFTTALTGASTAIADGAFLNDKVWFPRAILSLVPIGASLVNLAIFVGLMVATMLLLDGGALVDLWLLVPALALLVSFTVALGLVLSSVQVYFRDVSHMVGALIFVWFYLTPIVYPVSLAGSLGQWLELNPMTGVVGLFQSVAVDGPSISAVALAVSVGATVVLMAAGIGLQRHFDRLFVDRL